MFYIKMSAIIVTFPKILQVGFNLVFSSSQWQFHSQFCTTGTKGINNLKVVDVKKGFTLLQALPALIRSLQIQNWNGKASPQCTRLQKEKLPVCFLVCQKSTAAFSNGRFCMTASFSSCNVFPHCREVRSNRYSHWSQTEVTNSSTSLTEQQAQNLMDLFESMALLRI